MQYRPYLQKYQQDKPSETVKEETAKVAAQNLTKIRKKQERRTLPEDTQHYKKRKTAFTNNPQANGHQDELHSAGYNGDNKARAKFYCDGRFECKRNDEKQTSGACRTRAEIRGVLQNNAVQMRMAWHKVNHGRQVLRKLKDMFQLREY